MEENIKIIKIEYFILTVIFGVLNCKFSNNQNYQFVIFLQVGMILYLLLKRNLQKAYIYHCLFVMTSLKYHADIGLNTVVYNYATLKIMNKINYANIIIIILIVKCLFLKNKNENRKFLFLFKTTTLLIIFSEITGIIGLVFWEYDISDFIYKTVYFFYILSNMYILIKLFPDKITEIKKVVITVVFSSSVILIFNTLLNTGGIYGGNKILTTIDVGIFLIIFLLFIFEKKYSYLSFIGLTGVYYLKYNASGKFILLSLIVIIVFLYFDIKFIFNKDLKKNRRGLILLVTILFLIFIWGEKILNRLDSNLFRWKLFQVKQLLLLNYSNLPSSPKIRVIQIISIILEYFQKPYLMIFGLGSGGYYHDWNNLFLGIDLTEGAYSLKEIVSKKFIYVHDTYSAILKLHGISGVIYFFYWIKYLLIKLLKENKILTIIPLYWLLFTYGFNIYSVITISIMSFYIISFEKKTKSLI